jgi:fatty-acyl-CoA synthase
MRFQLFVARGALAALALAVLVGVAAVACVRLGLLTDKAGSTLMIPATTLGLVSLVLALLWLRSALVRNTGEGKRLGLIALTGSLAFLYFPLAYVYYGYMDLPIHDATTDPEDPPQFVALAQVHPANSRVFDGTSKIAYKGEQVPIAYALHDKYYLTLTKPHVGLLITPQKAYWRAHDAVQKLGWTIVDASEKDLRIEATDRSLWFGRISDIVLRIRPAGSIGVRVDVRSESRDGGIDHGRNVARLKAFFRQFKF